MTRVIVRRGVAPGIVPAMDVSSLNLALPTAGAGALDWVHLMPAGTFKGVTGQQTYHLRDPQKVITASMTAGKLPFDENHSTQRAHATGSPSPARGWITALEARDNGIWAKVDWNADGQALMTNKSYRNVSPVFGYAKDGTVTRIISAALTNDPNLAELTALHTQTGDHMEKKAICTALGIAETVDDAAVMTALQTASAATTRVATLEGEIAELKRTTKSVADFIALQTRVETMEQESKKVAATAFVDAAIKAGKPILPAREELIAQHCADPAATESFVNKLVSINARGTAKPPAGAAGEGTAEMTAEDMAICTAMGTDPAKLAEFRKKKTTEGSAA